MQPVYLINNKIYFFPAKKKLSTHIDDEKKEITSTQPAAKCLEILLKIDGLVLQREIYDFAWGENGRNVSPNTLYQNISLIRRALNKLQPDAGRWIITVPRQGFRIEQHITLLQVAVESPLKLKSAEPVKTFPSVTGASEALFPILKPFALVLLGALLLVFIVLVLPVNTDFQTTISRYHKLEKKGTAHLPLQKPKSSVRQS